MRSQAEGSGAILVDDKLHRGLALVPLQVRIDDSPVGEHDLAHLLGDITDLQRISAYDTKFDGVVHRRPEIEPGHARAGFGKSAIAERLLNLRLYALAPLNVVGQDNNLGVVRSSAIAG